MSKSGLPEALKALGGSKQRDDGEHPHNPPKLHKPSEAMCDIPGCLTRRVGMETMPNGERKPIFDQGFGDVVIKTKNGTLHGYVCQEHYIKILDEAGKDQLSCAGRSEQRIAQPDLRDPAQSPRGLIDHITELEQHFRASETEEALAERMAERHIPQRPFGVDLEDWDPIHGKVIQRARHDHEP